jgi:alkanesulfonate monooxygenase SsuD/methylene tetrahydromethanopterin reductase-like flavin-dependent oxidoreductase (luciferase family)
VFQRFSTLDALSHGRAEVMLGRGSFIESFPLFGFDLDRYEELFNEKLDLFAAVLTQQPVTWSGAARPPLSNQSVYPKTESGQLKTWIGVGGTPQSVMRAVHYGMPMMLAIIGGDPRRFIRFADLYRRALHETGKPALPMGVHSHGFVGETDAQARDDLFADYKRMRDRIGAERGWPPLTPSDFAREIEHGSLYVGSPETVARKIVSTAKALGVDRFDMKYSAGPLSHDKMMRCIELYGRKVIPLVRDMMAA